jgi:GNAT superfamily N-acetyltransferase
MLKDISSVLNAERTELPPSYAYADAGDISRAERRELDVQANGSFDSPLERAYWGVDSHGLTQCIDVGVRHTDDKALVGLGRLIITDYAGARIDINLLSGALSHLMVSPGHQGRGIGTSLLLERMRIAEELEVYKLSIRGLEDTNTIRNKYFGLGFEEDAKGMLHLNKRSLYV